MVRKETQIPFQVCLYSYVLNSSSHGAASLRNSLLFPHLNLTPLKWDLPGCNSAATIFCTSGVRSSPTKPDRLLKPHALLKAADTGNMRVRSASLCTARPIVAPRRAAVAARPARLITRAAKDEEVVFGFDKNVRFLGLPLFSNCHLCSVWLSSFPLPHCAVSSVVICVLCR